MRDDRLPDEAIDEPRAVRHATRIDVLVNGSLAVVRGVVERAEERRRIVEAIASLDSITHVEDHLRLVTPGPA